MKILVLGAGVVGTTTAYYLARAGASVTVVDRQGHAALETSFGNGAQISVCFCEPALRTPARFRPVIRRRGQRPASRPRR